MNRNTTERTGGSRLIHVRDGGLVGIARGPGGKGGHPLTALHIHGYEGFEELTDAEVCLEVDELERLVRELASRLPNEQKLKLAQSLAAPG